MRTLEFPRSGYTDVHSIVSSSPTSQADVLRFQPVRSRFAPVRRFISNAPRWGLDRPRISEIHSLVMVSTQVADRQVH